METFTCPDCDYQTTDRDEFIQHREAHGPSTLQVTVDPVESNEELGGL